MAVVAETDQGLDVPRLVEETRANLVLLGFGVRGMTSLEVVRRLPLARTKVPTIVFTTFDHAAYVEPLVRAGARGCLLRHAPSSDLVRAIELVHRGGTFFSPEIANALFQISPAARAGGMARTALTHREREVLAMVADGLTTKQIASGLGISERTALSHRENLMSKLGLHNAATLTRHAVAQGLVPLQFPVAH